MPNTLSAKKDLRQNYKRFERNLLAKNEIRYLIRQTKKSARNNEADKAQEYVKKAIKQIDKAVQKGIMKKNTAARKKSRILAYIKKEQTSK